MRGPGDRRGRRHIGEWGFLIVVLLLLSQAVHGRSKEAQEAREREKELKKELSALKKENRLREKEAHAQSKADKAREAKEKYKAQKSKKQLLRETQKANGLSLLQHDAAADSHDSNRGFFAGIWQWLKEFFRWLSGRQPTEAEHAAERAKRTKNYLNADYEVGGRYFASRPDLAFRKKVHAERPRGTVFDVASFGAVPDGKTDCTAMIQKAIDDAAAAPEGGVVLFGNGTWITGPLELRSRVTLWLSGAGSVLKAHGELDRWPTTPYQEHPLQPAYEPRVRHRPLLYGHSLEDVAIGGGGTVDGSGMAWWVRSDHERMRLAPAGCLHVLNVTNLTVTDTWFRDSPKFSIRPQFGRHVKIHNVVVDNPAGSKGTNGIVIDSCQDVEVTHCVVSTGFKEDALAVKSGEGEFGLLLNAPSRGVTFRSCAIQQGHAISIGATIPHLSTSSRHSAHLCALCVRIISHPARCSVPPENINAGSEMSGSVFDTRFEDIFFDGTETHGYGAGSLRVKSARGRGGVVDGVTFTNIKGKKMIHVLQIHAFFGEEEGGAAEATVPDSDSDVNGTQAQHDRDMWLPKIRNIFVSNVHVDSSSRTPFIIEGLPDSPVTGLVVENVTVKKFGKKAWDCSHYGGCSWEGGGCAVGVVNRVEPPPPDGCVRLQAPTMRR